MPLWMTEDEWEVTHPGFPSSSPSRPINRTELCKDAEALESSRFFNEGEERITVEYRVDEHVIENKDTIYMDVLFNFWVSKQPRNDKSFRECSTSCVLGLI